jgi:hypothetical protein
MSEPNPFRGLLCRLCGERVLVNDGRFCQPVDSAGKLLEPRAEHWPCFEAKRKGSA